MVRGPAVIGAGAMLEDAYIGPYTSIGDGVRVEGAEIEHSIVLAGAVIEHLGGRLEASVVGRGPACIATSRCLAPSGCGSETERDRLA